jgi:F-type H+-transporting ATPase subunit b
MEGSANLLAIDPAVLALQIAAFAILFLLLRRYLFSPLLRVIAIREREIAEALDAGERARQGLAQIEEERGKTLAQAREEGRELVRQSVREAEEQRARIVAEARQESQAARQRGQQAIELAQQAAELELRQQVVDLALLAASRSVLGRLDAEAHRQAVDDFIASLESLGPLRGPGSRPEA